MESVAAGKKTQADFMFVATEDATAVATLSYVVAAAAPDE
jgi:hypothetical protein